MEIKYQEGELVLEISESKYLKFSDETEYKKIFEIEEDPYFFKKYFCMFLCLH